MGKQNRPRAQRPPAATPAQRAAVDSALEQFPTIARHHSLPLLQAVQAAAGSLAPAVVAYISRRTGLAVADLYALVSFYDLLTDSPRAAAQLRICTDVACALDGRAAALVRALQEHLGIAVGQTTADGRFALVTTPCIGCCDRAPALLLSGRLLGPVHPEDLPALLHDPGAGREEDAPR